MQLSNDATHAWHVWMNRRQDERRGKQEPRERCIYEFKALIQYLEYGHKRIQEAFEGKLTDAHQHCSHSPVEKIERNVLKCCLGVDVTECPILLSLKETLDAEDARRVSWYRDHLKQDKPPMPEEEKFKVLSATCGWHIYGEATKNGEAWSGVDTSEGYHLDESDRRFWKRTYESMAYEPVENVSQVAQPTSPTAHAENSEVRKDAETKC